jgi:hypothetical protein
LSFDVLQVTSSNLPRELFKSVLACRRACAGSDVASIIIGDAYVHKTMDGGASVYTYTVVDLSNVISKDRI